VLIRQLPVESSYAQATLGEAARWGTAEYLMAIIADILNLANWQRSGRKGRKKPQPLPRPGMEEKSKKLSKGIHSIEEMAKIKAEWRAGKRKPTVPKRKRRRAESERKIR